jgi:excisionase family DNA binding protein
MSATRSVIPSRPSDDDVRLARHATSTLHRALERSESVSLTVSRAGGEETLEIPEAALDLLAEVLDELAKGHAVTVTTVDAEVSTQKAADLLNVSRPYLVELLEAGKIRFRKVGSHRRIRLSDVVEYRTRMDAEADRAFAELAEHSQRLGLYD